MNKWLKVSNSIIGIIIICLIVFNWFLFQPDLAKSLIENKLVACVNVIPKIKSYYMWEGKLNADEELLLMIKTKTILLDEITTFVKKNHPYDVPEVISAQLGPGNPDYYEWIGKSCK
jgi:periplasmic divalent cation tolerance protein